MTTEPVEAATIELKARHKPRRTAAGYTETKLSSLNGSRVSYRVTTVFSLTVRSATQSSLGETALEYREL